jgi:hypothetical protein
MIAVYPHGYAQARIKGQATEADVEITGRVEQQHRAGRLTLPIYQRQRAAVLVASVTALAV